MSHPYYHSKSSARKFGGIPEDYLAVHEWLDATKATWNDPRHRAIPHSAFGIYLAQQVFGETVTRQSDRKKVPTRLIGEQHVREDMGETIPSVQDWLQGIPVQPWMCAPRPLSQEGDL